MPRQYSSPILIPSLDGSGAAQALTPVEFSSTSLEEKNHKEKLVQRLIHDHPTLIPLEEIEPAFHPLYPVCMELRTESGFIDNLFVSANGGLTLVECKLWRNPEARREVVGQILDYAKDISQWSYEDLSLAVRSAVNREGNVLFDIVSSDNDDIDEKVFVDSVSRNLKKGRFLLLVVGDGIREGVENIANFLQTNSGLSFTFGLVEVALFKMPESAEILVQPRVIARTVTIEHSVVRVEGAGAIVEDAVGQEIDHASKGRAKTISEDDFYEALSASSGKKIAHDLRGFLSRVEELGIEPGYGSGSINLYWTPDGNTKINYGSIQKSGKVWTEMANWGPHKLNRLDLGHAYQRALAAAIPGAEVNEHENPGHYAVHKNGKHVLLRDLLDNQDAWLKVIEDAQTEIAKALS